MKIRKVISWILVILWMALIFSLSAQPAADSNQLSKGVTEIVIESVENRRYQVPNGSNGSNYFFEVAIATLPEDEKTNWKKRYQVQRGSNGSKRQ
jgi:VanZ family protein